MDLEPTAPAPVTGWFQRKKAFLVLIPLLILIISGSYLFATSRSTYSPLPAGSASVTKMPAFPPRLPTSSQSAKTTYIAQLEDDGSASFFRFPATGGEKKLLGKFPPNSKQLQLLDSNNVLYIANTDVAELGDRIIKRSLADNQDSVLYTPPEKFFVNSFLVSADGTQIVIWLVSPTIDGFKGGTSRIISTRLPVVQGGSIPTANVKILIEEKITGPTHYPIFWSGVTKRLYLGTFVPGGAMSLGVVSIDPSGGALATEPGMESGSYGGSIVLSPDNERVVLTRQTNTQTSNLPSLGSGFIPASERNTNAVVVVNLGTHKQQILQESTGGSIYIHPVWSEDGNSILVSELQVRDGRTQPVGFWRLAVVGSAKTPVGTGSEGEVIAEVGNGVLLLGIRVSPVGSLAGMQGTQTPVYGSYYLVYPDNKYVKVYLEKPSQVVGIL